MRKMRKMNIFCVLTSTYMSLRSLVDDNADAVVWMPLTKCDVDGRISVGEGRGGDVFDLYADLNLCTPKHCGKSM